MPKRQQTVKVQPLDRLERAQLLEPLGQAAEADGVRTTIDEATKTDAAKKVGAAIAKALLAKGIDKVVFDRNGYLYHGRVRALADAAREAGLKF